MHLWEAVFVSTWVRAFHIQTHLNINSTFTDFNSMCQVVGNIYSGYYYGWLNDQFTQGDSFPYHAYLLWGSTTCLSSYNVCALQCLKSFRCPCSSNLTGWILWYDVQQLLLPLLPLKVGRGARAAFASHANALTVSNRNRCNFENS